MDDDKLYDFDMAKSPQTIIKVIGVGGGGGNAVSNMYREGIRDVSFVLCNTDNQALQKSEVPDKLLIGQTGLGAGDEPERGEKAALESEEEIRKIMMVIPNIIDIETRELTHHEATTFLFETAVHLCHCHCNTHSTQDRLEQS